MIRNLARQVPDALAASYRANGLWDDRGLSHGLEAAAAARPDALAVADAERRISHGELVARIRGAAAILVERSIRPRDGVVLIAGNTTRSCASVRRSWSSIGAAARRRCASRAKPSAAVRS